MASKKLSLCIIAGAFVGGIVALTDKEVRKELKTQLQCGKELVQNPSTIVTKARTKIEDANEFVDRQTENILNIFEQVEGTLSRFGDEEPIDIGTNENE